MEKIVVTYTLKELDSIVDLLMARMATCTVFTFVGSLGAGKTTLIRALLRRCGVEGTITSPTFTYVNVYRVEDTTLYHFDLYRVQSTAEFVAAGFAEYLEQPHSWSFIEWPEYALPLLHKPACFVTLDYIDDTQRRITLEIAAPHEQL